MCRALKPLNEFSVRRASPDGLAYKCRECNRQVCREFKARNPGAFKDWYANNKDKRAEYWTRWYSENKDSRAAGYKTWAAKNKHIVNALIARRSAAKKKATVAWANSAEIRRKYAEAAYLTASTGIRHEVDHFYPLQGKRVCGLHCEANLRVITKAENIRKSNKMPEECNAA